MAGLDCDFGDPERPAVLTKILGKHAPTVARRPFERQRGKGRQPPRYRQPLGDPTVTRLGSKSLTGPPVGVR
jgi:hypothetical protein